MVRVRLTLEEDGAVCVESPYDPGFVEGLKRAIDSGGRKWEPSRKRWIISALYADYLMQFLTQVGAHIQDDRASAGAVTALPPMPPELRTAFDHLYLAYNAPLYVAEAVYKGLSKLYHPDMGGQAEHFYQINDAIATIRRYLDPKPTDADEDDAGIPF